jgi:hypothetical protein
LAKKALKAAQEKQTKDARDTKKKIEKEVKIVKHVEKDYNVHFIFRDPPKLSMFPPTHIYNQKFPKVKKPIFSVSSPLSCSILRFTILT